jgi:hypothetical protein
MDQRPATDIVRHFEGLSDPRTGNAKTHIFLEILIIAICAVICGADGWSDVELFGKNKKEWLKTFLKLPKGVPSHDTFGRVFAKIKPEEFQKRFIEWVQAITTFARSGGWESGDLYGECLGNPKRTCLGSNQSCRQIQ